MENKDRALSKEEIALQLALMLIEKNRFSATPVTGNKEIGEAAAILYNAILDNLKVSN